MLLTSAQVMLLSFVGTTSGLLVRPHGPTALRSPHGIATRPHDLAVQRRLQLLPLRPTPRTAPPRCAQQEDAAPVERLFACLPYLLPVLDGFSYGAYVYANVPLLGRAAMEVAPAVGAFQSSPFSGFVLFIGLSFFTRNSGLPRFVRFNIQQALLLDITLIIPGLFGAVPLPRDLAVVGSNFVFYFWVLVVGYSVFCNVRGKTPDQVPVLSEAASLQIGPF